MTDIIEGHAIIIDEQIDERTLSHLKSKRSLSNMFGVFKEDDSQSRSDFIVHRDSFILDFDGLHTKKMIRISSNNAFSNITSSTISPNVVSFTVEEEEHGDMINPEVLKLTTVLSDLLNSDIANDIHMWYEMLKSLDEDSRNLDQDYDDEENIII